MPVDLLMTDLLGKPAWLWLLFLSIVLVLLVLDLGVLHRGSREIGVRESLLLSTFYVALGLGFGGLVWARAVQFCDPGRPQARSRSRLRALT